MKRIARIPAAAGEAEDAVQQAFVSAHGAMRRGSREIAFKPWLYTIARNRCLSMLRARRERVDLDRPSRFVPPYE